MAFPVNVAAALLTVLFRRIFRTATYDQGAPLPSSPSLPLRAFTPLAVLATGALCCLPERKCQDFIEKLRSFSVSRFRRRPQVEDHHTVVNPGMTKAKTCMESNFQGSRKLQQSALRYVAEQAREENLPLRNNTLQKVTRFIPKRQNQKSSKRTKCHDRARLIEKAAPRVISHPEEPLASTSRVPSPQRRALLQPQAVCSGGSYYPSSKQQRRRIARRRSACSSSESSGGSEWDRREKRGLSDFSEASRRQRNYSPQFRSPLTRTKRHPHVKMPRKVFPQTRSGRVYSHGNGKSPPRRKLKQ